MKMYLQTIRFLIRNDLKFELNFTPLLREDLLVMLGHLTPPQTPIKNVKFISCYIMFIIKGEDFTEETLTRGFVNDGGKNLCYLNSLFVMFHRCDFLHCFNWEMYEDRPFGIFR